MPAKKLDDVNVGDVLAKDLTNSQGAVLVKAGAAITESHLRLLRMWGVSSVEVADPAGGTTGAAAVTEKLLDEAEAAIRMRFGASLDNEVMAEILRVAVELRAAAMAAAGDVAGRAVQRVHRLRMQLYGKSDIAVADGGLLKTSTSDR